jgi:hypothetical protein
MGIRQVVIAWCFAYFCLLRYGPVKGLRKLGRRYDRA